MHVNNATIFNGIMNILIIYHHVAIINVAYALSKVLPTIVYDYAYF